MNASEQLNNGYLKKAREDTRNFTKLQKLKKDLKYNRWLYIMIVPVVLFYVIFCYAPMYGIIIAFKDFSPLKGIMGSDWDR
jgi:ABC-type polysaccharide transport system permease subunit